MTIGELAKTFGVQSSSLRFYERIGLLHPAGRISGRRRYDQTAKMRLAFILSARESGFTLAEIKGFIDTSSKGASPHKLWPRTAGTKRLKIEKEIRRLRTVQQSLKRKAACRCKTLEECEKKLAREHEAASRQ